jgi:hypothetical protein
MAFKGENLSEPALHTITLNYSQTALIVTKVGPLRLHIHKLRA